jgi:hypothetical protein
MTDETLKSLAASIVTAEAAVDLAATRVADAAGARNKILARISAYTAERTVISARRAGGDHQPGDGASLELIAVDREGLEDLMPAAEAELAAANGEHADATRALQASRVAYKREEARQQIAALDAHADELTNLLFKTLQARHAAAAALPIDQQEFSSTVGRLAIFDALLVDGVKYLRSGAPFANLPYSKHPTWQPSESLFSDVWRLQASNGRIQ